MVQVGGDSIQADSILVHVLLQCRLNLSDLCGGVQGEINFYSISNKSLDNGQGIMLAQEALRDFL